MRAVWGLGWIVLLALMACAPEPVTERVEVTREVEVTRLVKVTQLATVEVTVVVLAPTPPSAAPTLAASSALTTTGPSLATLVAGASPEPTAACWTWQEAALHLGETGCVEATVTAVGQSSSALFVNFDADRRSFYVVSFDWAWEELEGECLRVEGTVSEFRGRPQIIVDDPSQLRYCGSEDSPPAFPR